MHKALFLDRDGIINVDSGYVSSMSDFIFVDGLFSFLQRAQEKGFRLMIVTNQSGIARGFYTEQDFLTLMAQVSQILNEHGIKIDATYYCPYHPDGVVPIYTKEHPDRKPSPGMILRAIADHHVDPLQSYIIGDHWRDMEAGYKAGLKGGYFVSALNDSIETPDDMAGFDLHRVDKVSDLATFF